MVFGKKKNQIRSFVEEIIKGFREVPEEHDRCDYCKGCRERAEEAVEEVQYVFKRFL